MTVRWLLAPILALLLACGGIFASPLERAETAATDHISELGDLEQRALDEADKSKARAMAAVAQKALDAAPKEEAARMKALSQIPRMDPEEFRALKTSIKEAEKKDLAPIRADFNGIWDGPSGTLIISKHNLIQYKPKGVGVKLKNMPIQVFRRDRLEVGLFGMGRTFVIDVLPHDDGGTWKMTVDGEVYTLTKRE